MEKEVNPKNNKKTNQVVNSNNNSMNKKSKADDISEFVLSGGHFATLAFLGKIQYLIYHENLDIKKINKWICTSGGCIVALLLSIGYSPLEIKDTLKEINFSKISPLESHMWLNFFDSLGLHDSNKISNIISLFLEHKNFDKNITFGEFYDETGIQLTFMVFCLNTCELIELNYKQFANMKIIEGLSMAISAPFIFKPKFFQNRLYIDAVVNSNCPALKTETEYAYVFRLCNSKSYYDNINLFNYVKILIKSMIKQLEDYEVLKSNHRIFNIPCDYSFNASLNLDSEKIDELFKCGFKN